MQDDPLPPTLVVDDSAAPASTATEGKANEAYDAVFSWHGNQLEPYSLMRDRIFERLQALDSPVPDTVRQDCPQFVLYDAEKVLALCSLTEQQLLPIMGKPLELLKLTQQWGQQHIASAEGMAAIRLANAIIKASEATRAIERPSRSGSATPGN